MIVDVQTSGVSFEDLFPGRVIIFEFILLFLVSSEKLNPR